MKSVRGFKRVDVPRYLSAGLETPIFISLRHQKNRGAKMQPSGRGYDHGITTFSPDGRLFQVEYARESVKRGTTTAGLKFKDGVV